MNKKKPIKIVIVEEHFSLSKQVDSFLKEEEISYFSTQTYTSLNDLIGFYQPDLLIAHWPLTNNTISLDRLKPMIQDIPVLFIAPEEQIETLYNLKLEHCHCMPAPLQIETFKQFIQHYLTNNQENGDSPIAEDPSSKQLLKLAEQVAKFNVPVMISGESGVGKELIAHYIHTHSERANGPFIAINCAAIPATMLEAIMFGYVKGAFSGAIKDHPGKFEQAQHGTILLDEISEMPIELQAKLLRIIQEKEVERIGSQKMISLDVRIIATTNRNLQQEVAKGNFRMDLFYRLNVFPIHWIPLRHRLLDIIPLTEYLINIHAVQMKRQPPKLTNEAKDLLMAHDWPGNAREVDNVVQRALIIQPGPTLDAKDFRFDHIELWSSSILDEKESPVQSLEEQEYELIIKTLERTQGNRSKAAQVLKISPRTLRYKLAKMKTLGMNIPKNRSEPMAMESNQ